VRVPGCWNGFELAVRTILGQGCADGAGAAGRVARDFGRQFFAGQGLTHLFPDPETLAESELERAGIPAACSKSIRALAGAVRSGQIAFDRAGESRAFVAGLRKIAGMDESTAQYVAMRALGEPDIFPIRNKALKVKSASWCPWRAYAAMYLWSESGGAARVDAKRSPHGATSRKRAS
jgi:3-methyladenine DNA glycosylase/8-oxoguanine DNA glycosylase